MKLTPKTAAERLQWQCKSVGLPVPTLEARFHPTRRWKFDAAWMGTPVGCELALEVEGGVFLPGGGRHNRGSGFRKDCEKYAEAAILGWHIIRVLPEDVTSGKALRWVERFFEARGIRAGVK